MKNQYKEAFLYDEVLYLKYRLLKNFKVLKIESYIKCLYLAHCFNPKIMLNVFI